ncbi:hypothetical protein T265_08309 [Opisthorchis viverrini]|uniref:Uncharacterized protein n=1 Tax=Opisthorchis viverrini TaxID=6198 RepID=A0A074ZE70_OPIVI|nr:hypothetical protein T265_08309 [Opisthorchis viverrini]KER23952.1 hypothetical protein T265_08309 [Opisthorchis viverrini]
MGPDMISLDGQPIICVSNRMCCIRPPHVSFGMLFEISRYMYIRNTRVSRYLKYRTNSSMRRLGTANSVAWKPKLFAKHNANKFHQFYRNPSSWQGIQVDETKRPHSARNLMSDFGDAERSCFGTEGTYVQLGPCD